MMRQMSSANDMCPSSQSLLLERSDKGASNRLLKSDSNPSPPPLQRLHSASSVTANVQVGLGVLIEE